MPVWKPALARICHRTCLTVLCFVWFTGFLSTVSTANIDFRLQRESRRRSVKLGICETHGRHLMDFNVAT